MNCKQSVYWYVFLSNFCNQELQKVLCFYSWLLFISLFVVKFYILVYYQFIKNKFGNFVVIDSL